jgi:hypothetical protein
MLAGTAGSLRSRHVVEVTFFRTTRRLERKTGDRSDPPFVLPIERVRILLESLLRLVAPCERLVGRAHVLVCGTFLVDGRLARVFLGAFGVGVVPVDLRRVLVRDPCALVGARSAEMGVGGILARRRDRIEI